MQQRSGWVGICAGVLGLTLALAPLTAASAKSHKTKGSAPNSAMCKKVKSEQSGSGTNTPAIEKAMTSGNFAQAKAALLKAYSNETNSVQSALSVVRSAPPKVQTAFKNLLSSVKQFRTAIQNTTSMQGMVASFATLGKNARLEADGVTISNWYTSVCGGALITTTTASTP